MLHACVRRLPERSSSGSNIVTRDKALNLSFLRNRWLGMRDRLRRSFARRQMILKSKLLAPTEQSAVIFAPHHDDETLGCGGLIAAKRQRGVPVWVVFLTDGSKCYPASAPMTPKEVSELRRREALQALEILGVAPLHVHFLQQPDAGLQYLSESSRQALLGQLLDLLRQIAPQEIYVPYRNDAHWDHMLTYALVLEVLQALGWRVDTWQYFVSSLWKIQYLCDLSPADFENLYRLAIHQVQDQKRKALAVYRSQYLPVAPDIPAVLGRGFMDYYSLPYELYLKTGA